MTEEDESRNRGGDGCLPFILGVIVGGSCFFPRGCDYQQPRIRELSENRLEITETPFKTTIYERQENREYLPVVK